ncbi:hypothetical protein NPIL_112061, partial [Nephila pilipes]
MPPHGKPSVKREIIGGQRELMNCSSELDSRELEVVQGRCKHIVDIIRVFVIL